MGSKQIGQEQVRARLQGGERRIEIRATLNRPERFTVRGRVRLRRTFQPIRVRYDVSTLAKDCRYELILRRGIFYLVYTQGARHKVVTAEQVPTVQVMSLPVLAGSLAFVCQLAKATPVTLWDFPGIRFTLSARKPWRPKGLPFLKLTRVRFNEASTFICDGAHLVAMDSAAVGFSIVDKAYLVVRAHLGAYKAKPTQRFTFPFHCNRLRSR